MLHALIFTSSIYLIHNQLQWPLRLVISYTWLWLSAISIILTSFVGLKILSGKCHPFIWHIKLTSIWLNSPVHDVHILLMHKHIYLFIDLFYTGNWRHAGPLTLMTWRNIGSGLSWGTMLQECTPGNMSATQPSTSKYSCMYREQIKIPHANVNLPSDNDLLHSEGWCPILLMAISISVILFCWGWH